MSRRSSDAGTPRLLAPWLAGIALLYAGPTAVAAVLACTEWDGLSWAGARFVGAGNLRRAVFEDGQFRRALLNSIGYTAMNVPVQVAAGVGLALLIRQSRRRVALWATAYYLPHMLGGVATVLIHWWLFNPQVGPINRAILAAYELLDGPARALGFGTTRGASPPPWLYSPTWCRPTLVLMNLWEAGGGALICLAALLRGGEAQYEAAQLDGAGPWRRFVHVTLPRLGPAIWLNAVAGVVFSMQAFNQPFLLSNAQQQDQLSFYSVYMYRCAFEFSQFGYATALAWILLLLLLAFSGAAVLIARRWIHHDLETGAEA